MEPDLILRIRAMGAAGQPGPALWALLAQARQELDDHELATERFVGDLQELYVEWVWSEVRRAYQVYREALAAVGERLTACATGDWTAELVAAGDSLKRSLISLRRTVWEARGPSSHPGANELLWYLSELPQGRVEVAAFRAAVSRERTRFAEPRSPLQQSLPPLCRQALDEALAIYGRWLEAVWANPEDHDWPGLAAELQAWSEDYSAWDLEHHGRYFGWGPTLLPAVNTAVHGRRRAVDGALAPELSELLLEWADEALRQGQERVLAQSDWDGESRTAIFQGVAGLRQLLRQGLDLVEPELVATWSDQVQAAAEQLAARHASAKAW